MRKAIAAASISASIVGGSLAVATLSPLGIAGAEDDPAAAEGSAERHAPMPRVMILDQALDSLVEDGTLTAEQADAVRERVRELAPEGPHRPRIHDALQVAAETIGIEFEDLVAALADGSSIAEVAESEGVDPQTVIDALVAAAVEKIDQAVADGHLDEEQAAEIKEGLEERITEMVNSEPPRPGPHPPGHPGGGPFGGPGGPGFRGPGSDVPPPEAPSDGSQAD